MRSTDEVVLARDMINTAIKNGAQQGQVAIAQAIIALAEAVTSQKPKGHIRITEIRTLNKNGKLKNIQLFSYQHVGMDADAPRPIQFDKYSDYEK